VFTSSPNFARAALDAAPDAMIVIDSAAVIRWANRQVSALFGYPKDDLIGQPVEVLIPGRFRERHVEKRQAYARNPHTRPMGRGLDLFGLRQDGTEFPVEISLSPIQGNDTGDVLIAAAIRDVSERKDLEAQLRAQVEDMRRLHAMHTRLMDAAGLPQMLEAILDTTIALQGADVGDVQLYDTTTRSLRIVAQRGNRNDFVAPPLPPGSADDRSCARALREKSRIIIEDTDRDVQSAPGGTNATRERYRALQSTPILGPDGTTAGVLSTHFRRPHVFSIRELQLTDVCVRVAGDLIVRTQTQGALHHSQQLLQGVVEFSDDAIITQTLEGIITSWNPAARRLFGYTAQQTVGQPIQMLIPPERLDEEKGSVARIGRGELVDHLETIRLRVDGTRIDVSVTISPLKDGSGRVIGASKIVRDISERKAQERKVQAQLARLNLLQQIHHTIEERQDVDSMYRAVIRGLEEHFPVDLGCIALCQPGSEFFIVNRVGTRRDLAMEVGLSEQSAVPIAENGLDRCVRGELLYEADTAQRAYRFPARLASAGLRSVIVAPLSVENNISGVLIAARRGPQGFTSGDCDFLRQISDRVALAAHNARLYSTMQKAYEELRQTQQTVVRQERLRALGQMASGIAHDINNALSPAVLYAQLMLGRDRGLGAEAREHLSIIERAMDDVVRTVTRMRRFYHPGELERELSPTDVNALLQQVAEITRARWKDMPEERGIVIELRNLPTPGLPRIIGAENEIRDALINLVLNAVDAMPNGGVLTLRSSVGDASKDPAGARWASIEVSDTGVGMSEAVRRRCLEPFFTTKGKTGTGLGLAMVHGMVERHNGEIEIESEPGRGTTVRINFPVASGLLETPPVPTDRTTKALRILLVDDDTLLLKSLCDVLESEGHGVVPADGGQKGIDEFMAARQHGQAFDVVISDQGMPAIDGRKVAAAIKSADRSTPFILLTGWGQALQAEHDTSDDFDRVLSKPPHIAELRRALEELTRSNSCAPRE
jgi:PAS domain S-box-containing protein